MIKLFKAIYFNDKFFYSIGIIVLFFVLGYNFNILFFIGRLLFVVFISTVIVDFLILFHLKGAIEAKRVCPEKLSNSDENIIRINITNHYGFKIDLKIIDELPEQFQKRDFMLLASPDKHETIDLSYKLIPLERGEYHFGFINIYSKSFIGLVERRHIFDESKVLPVYPSFVKMHHFELIAATNKLIDTGIKHIRRVGNTLEFEQIRQYVKGDDYRTINWKATARSSNLMVNQFQDERSQNVISCIDTGRTMKMPFGGMTLLEYAINASLIISNIAINKYDKAGLITFSKQIDKVVPPERRSGQVSKLLEALYKVETNHPEANFALLNSFVKSKINSRSLMLLFTNFETISGMERNLSYLRSLAKSHLVVTIFFENTELTEIIRKDPENPKGIYTKVIAERLAFEKKKITLELKKYGIHTIYTSPEDLNINTINKYLEIKSRRLL